MEKNPTKDFSPIADDYAFFMEHSTEAEQDLRGYLSHVAGWRAGRKTINMLDFGCGSGEFSDRFLERLAWSPDNLRLALVEPVEAQRRQAAERLGRFTTTPIAHWSVLPGRQDPCFDLILANHVFYYVAELETSVAMLRNALSSTGLFIAAISGRDNALFRFWASGFALRKQPVPYYVGEDFEAILRKLSFPYRKESFPYTLIFPDSEVNRMKILRFLLADHLAEMPTEPLLRLFDDFVRQDRIDMSTQSTHFIIEPPQ